jgi:putative ABC transport system substrate-binding protein
MASLPRRRLLALLAGTLASRPIGAQRSGQRRIGFLGIGDAQDFFSGGRRRLLGALAGLGYVEGRNLAIEECYEKTSPEKLFECARKLASLGVEVIVTEGTPSTLAAQAATRTIPIVTNVGDPVLAGFARELHRPGGNITGLSQNRAALATTQVELMLALRPRLKVFAIVFEEPCPGAEALARPLVEAARAASISARISWSRPGEFPRLRQDLKGQRIDTLVPYGIPEAEFAATTRAGIAIIANAESDVENGALASIEPDGRDSYLEAAAIVDKLLRGADPAQVPFSLPTRYRSVANAKTARALGMRLGPEVRLRMDRIIE